MDLGSFLLFFPPMRRLPIIALVLCTLTLVACQKPATPLPEGVQTVSGTLQAVPLSLKRRGTHALLNSQGTISAYVESRSTDLSKLDGHEVVLRGTFEKNLSDDLPPVFVVESVLEGGQEALRPWSIPALKLSIKLPKSWEGNLKGNVASFTGSGNTAIVLEIRQAEAPIGSSSSAAAQSSKDSFSVGLRSVSAELSADSKQWVVKTLPKDANERATIFTFVLAPEIPPEQQIVQFKKFLKTAEFKTGIQQQQSSATAQSRSTGPAPLPSGSSLSVGAGEGMPCGGPAGVLCPSGFICKITDTTLDSGVCAKR
jgi:hypothetical protein